MKAEKKAAEKEIKMKELAEKEAPKEENDEICFGGDEETLDPNVSIRILKQILTQ